MTVNNISEKLIVSNDYLFRLAYSFTKNSDDALDLLQDTRYKVLTKWRLFKEGTNFQAWVHTIMRNHFINNYRKKKTKEKYMQAHESSLNLTMSSKALDFPMVQEKVFKEIEQLKPALKSVITMHMEGYRYEEIAEELQLPLGTVKSRIHQSRKHLRSRFKQLEIL